MRNTLGVSSAKRWVRVAIGLLLALVLGQPALAIAQGGTSAGGGSATKTPSKSPGKRPPASPSKRPATLPKEGLIKVTPDVFVDITKLAETARSHNAASRESAVFEFRAGLRQKFGDLWPNSATVVDLKDLRVRILTPMTATVLLFENALSQNEPLPELPPQSRVWVQVTPRGRLEAPNVTGVKLLVDDQAVPPIDDQLGSREFTNSWGGVVRRTAGLVAWSPDVLKAPTNVKVVVTANGQSFDWDYAVVKAAGPLR